MFLDRFLDAIIGTLCLVTLMGFFGFVFYAISPLLLYVVLGFVVVSAAYAVYMTKRDRRKR